MAVARGDKFIDMLANVLRLILESISLREQLGNAIIVERRDV